MNMWGNVLCLYQDIYEDSTLEPVCDLCNSLDYPFKVNLACD